MKKVQRPHRIDDITGKKFGRLRVIKLLGVEGGYAEWMCQCDCGKKYPCVLIAYAMDIQKVVDAKFLRGWI